MAKISKRAAENRYYKARMSAAKENDRLSSRESASELVLISEDRLGSIEVGDTIPRADEVLSMARTYQMPALVSYYCSSICPLGEILEVPVMNAEDLDRTVMRILGLLTKFDAEELRRRLTLIAADGKITPDEEDEFSAVLETLGELSDSILALKFWAKTQK